jgi:hypothetical protein
MDGKLTTDRPDFPKWKMLTSVGGTFLHAATSLEGITPWGISFLFDEVRRNGLWNLSGRSIKLAKIGDLCRD